MFGRINPENQAFEWAPVNFVTPEGATIMNFCFNEELMRQYGFKSVDEATEPEFGPNQFTAPNYRDMGEYIQQTWEIVDGEIE